MDLEPSHRLCCRKSPGSVRLHDSTMAEIAREMGIPRTTLYDRLSKLRRLQRGWLTDYPDLRRIGPGSGKYTVPQHGAAIRGLGN